MPRILCPSGSGGVFAEGGGFRSFVLIPIWFEDNDGGSFGSGGEAGGGKEPAFVSIIAHDQISGIAPDGLDAGACDGKFYGLDEDDFIGPEEGFSRNDEDVLDDITFNFSANGLTDSKRGSGSILLFEGEGIIDAGDDEEFAGFFVE